MTETFGHFIEHLPQNRDALELTFIPSSRPIKQRWRNNRLSAYFVADYFSTFLPISDDEPNSQRRQKKTKGAVSYVANELLENAMKFNDETANYPIKFGIHFIEDQEITVVLFVTNTISSERKAKFLEKIEEILNHDPQELYLQQLEKTLELEGSIPSSGLGLLTMINDYSATLGWKFEQITLDSTMTTVTTMAQIPL